MATRIQIRRDTSSNWTSSNPTLAQGEIGFETNTGDIKIGDGTTAWTTLGYFTGAGGATFDFKEDNTLVLANPTVVDVGHGLDGSDAGTGRALIVVDETELDFSADPVNVGKAFSLSGDISPAQIVANQDNYAPTGNADASVFRLNTDASRDVTGIAGGTDGRVVLLFNVGSFAIVLKHDVTSTAANRFYCPEGVDFTVAAATRVVLVYDSTASRWLVLGVARSTATPGAVGTAAVGTAGKLAREDHVHASGAGTPSTQAFGDAAATGSGPAASMTDHKHAMPADPVTAHAEAVDPHTGYVLESLLDAKGDLIAASADNTPARFAVGSDDYMLMADAAAGQGLKWVAPGVPIAVATANAEGSTDGFSRTDHAHAHEVAHVAHDTVWDAKGDIVAATGADAATKLAVGANGTRLEADSGQSTGVKWATTLFSAGGTITDPTAARFFMVWRAPFACTVTNVRGHRKGGTGATVNARRNQTSDHLAADLSLSTADAWADGGAVQNTAYAAGDDLEIEIASLTGTVTELSIQVDFTRP